MKTLKDLMKELLLDEDDYNDFEEAQAKRLVIMGCKQMAKEIMVEGKLARKDDYMHGWNNCLNELQQNINKFIDG